MPPNDRRNAHRYTPSSDGVRLGWWEGKEFRVISARLRNLSMSGALLHLDGDAGCLVGGKAWICLADHGTMQWVQAEILGMSSEPETQCQVRLRFIDAFPYEAFKIAVWGDRSRRETTASPVVDDTPAPCTDEELARRANLVTLTERERIRFFLQLDPQPVVSSRPGPCLVALPSPQPPTLLEAHRSQRPFADKAASFPWLVTLFICLTASILLALLATGRFMDMHRLGIILGLND
jgi:hypothetical protein